MTEVSRMEAASGTACLAIMLGVCCLMLHFTVWRQDGEPVQFYDTVPGIDLGRVPPDRRQALVKTLNAQRCLCGCLRSVASCRNRHKSCEISLPAARAAAEAAMKP